MEILMGVLVGLLMAASVWLMLSRNLVKFLFGLVLISNVANLVIFASGGVKAGAPALLDKSGVVGDFANALPQALVLTAIVIGFGLVSFTLILALRAYESLGTVAVDDMCIAERRDFVAPWDAQDDSESSSSGANNGSGDPGDSGKAGNVGSASTAGKSRSDGSFGGSGSADGADDRVAS